MATSSLISNGFLSTAGGQVVDAAGNAVRLQSIAWFGTEGPQGSTLGGLDNNNPNDPNTIVQIKSYLTQIVAEGFNTVRIPWSDVNLQTALPVFQAIVAQAGQLGLKIIFDHHDDDGNWSQQPNGLWFDTGSGSDGTDGAGHTGTISAAQFQADTVSLAKAFAGNSTVVGFDLDNEPLVAGATGNRVNWGQGGPDDIQAMYSTVGSAVEAVDPGAMIIAEGPQNWSGTLLNGTSGMATEGDLSAVAADPVKLTVNGQTVANKVVYSVHEYPSTIGGEPSDSGSAYVQQMNNAWGYLETNNIAPVWIGEMGGSFDNGGGVDAGSGSQLADEQAWAATIVSYLNGKDGAQGGPTVATGFDWWASGNFPGGAPDGYNSGPNGSVNSGQQAVVSQLLTYQNSGSGVTPSPTPTVTPKPTPSANGTVVKAGSSAAITDASGNKWTITAGAQVAVNGTTDATTARVTELAYVNGSVYQENADNLWWSKTSPTASWVGGTATSPLPASTPSPTPTPKPTSTPSPTPTPKPTASANDTVVKAGSSAAITDASGNKWTITAGAQVAVNGTTDATTARVTELAYVNGSVYQENADSLWWSKTSPTASWVGGTAANPMSVTLATSQSSATVSLSQISISATAGNHMLFLSGSNDTVSLSGGTETITDTGTSNTYVIPAAGKGELVFAKVPSLTDIVDLRPALAATDWNGDPTTLAGYLHVTTSTNAAVLGISATSGGAGTAVLAINTAGTTTLASMLAHVIT
jgi:endoglucanase